MSSIPFSITLLFASLVSLLLSASASADAAWETCLARLQDRAITDGIPAATVTAVLQNVEQLPRVISSDRKQPEFTQTFTEYYSRRVTEGRTTKGRELMQRHLRLLSDIQTRTGVPPQYLLALWGLETNFGSYFGNLPLPSALATLACDQRRPDFFTRQLLATMRIVDAGDMQQADMIGSWAGAVGHMQFMPTTFLDHAVDGDQDGRRDLIGSIADALWSGGTYLQALGWQSGFRWGREVKLPDDFDYALTGMDQWRPLAEWADMRVTDVFGRPLPPLDTSSAVLVPSGHRGPAFVVYPNFEVIMGWNRSEFYALSVGRLADRIAGAGRLNTPLPEDRIATSDVIALQRNLAELGFDAGTPDGVVGPATRRAIRAFQQQQTLIADGYPHPEVISRAVAVNGASTD